MLVGDVFLGCVSWFWNQKSKVSYINRNNILFVVSTGKSGLYLELIADSQRLQFMV